MAKVALTALGVERIKPPAKGQVTVFDSSFPGLALRVSYGGAKSWTFFYGKDGKMVLGRWPGMGLADARERWRECRALLAKGIDPRAQVETEKEAAREDLFETVARNWLKRDQAKHRTYSESVRLIEKHVLPAWGKRPIHDITAKRVLALLDAIADEGRVSLARHVYARLHRLFRWSVKRHILAASPMVELDKPGAEPEPRDRVLSDGELRLVWTATGELGFPFQPAIRLLVLTGARRAEIGNLKWDEVGDDAIELPRHRVKNKQPRVIGLSPPARDILTELPRFLNCPFVFTTTGKTPVSGWSVAKCVLDRRIAALNGGGAIPAWTIHDLRRTIASGMQRRKVQLQVIETVLGHTSGSRAGVVGVYQRHAFLDEAREALDDWARFVLALAEGGPDNVVALRS